MKFLTCEKSNQKILKFCPERQNFMFRISTSSLTSFEENFVYNGAKEMAKRNLEDFEEDISENKRFLSDLQGEKKHTLDPDESDNEEDP